jgi:4-hydroxy-tetrahydrodipicolinate synthase
MKPDTGAIDLTGLRKLLQYHIDAGTDNLCILGTTGEASLMTMDERAAVLQVAVDKCKGVMPILVGTGTINPVSCKALTQQAIDIGCDASLLVTPYYVKPPQRGLIRHATDLADMGLPVILYNVPGRTGVNMQDESIAIASQHPAIVGCKDATGDLSRVPNLRRLITDPAFLLYSGDDETTVEFCVAGGNGCISVTANLAAAAMRDMVAAALAGKEAEAQEINDRLVSIHKDIFCESNPIAVKWAAKRMGMIDSAYCRPPLDYLDPTLETRVEKALRRAGLL